MSSPSYRLKFKNYPPILPTHRSLGHNFLKYAMLSSTMEETQAVLEPSRSNQGLQPVSQEINTLLSDS